MYIIYFIILAGIKMCDADEDNSLLSMTTSQDGNPPPVRVEWPKVIVTFCVTSGSGSS